MNRFRSFRLAMVALIPAGRDVAGSAPRAGAIAAGHARPRQHAGTAGARATRDPGCRPPAEPTRRRPPAAAQAPATPPPAAPGADRRSRSARKSRWTPKKVVIIKGTANWDSAFDTLIDSFKSLTALLDKQGIKPAGNPMIVYTSTDDTGFTFLAEIPVDQEPKNLTKDMSIGKSPDGKALKFVHRGSYDNMDNTYEAITNHLDDKKLEAKDTFIEEYITDPLKTAEDKLVINVYVPLK